MFRAVLLSTVLIASVAIGNEVQTADACTNKIGMRRSPKVKRSVASKNPSRILIVGSKDAELIKKLRGARHRIEYASTVASAKRDRYDLVIAADAKQILEAKIRFPNSRLLKKKSSLRKTSSVVEVMLARRASRSTSGNSGPAQVKKDMNPVNVGIEGATLRTVKERGYEPPESSVSRQGNVASFSSGLPKSPEKASAAVPSSSKQGTNKARVESNAKTRKWTRSITFGTNSTRLNSSQMQRLKANALLLKDKPGARITIEGHTDSVGDEAYNLDLSERRANMARDFLISFGISGARISVDPKGEADPAFKPSTSGRNRRIVMIKK